MVGVPGEPARALDPAHAQLAEGRLGQPEVAVQIVELLLETRQPVEMLIR